MINQAAQVSDADIMKHISQVICRRQGNCRNRGVRDACVRCNHNRTGLHIEDNYRPKIEGLKYL